MKHKIFTTIILMAMGHLSAAAAIPTTLDSIRNVLDSASTALVQEKAYVHLGNTFYFVGDTMWYKAYVVRADNLHFTDMSHILYVELLSPDGLVVERQQLIVSDKGFCCGDFALKDSLYSGFYEIRAYTRWMLNFNMSEHENMRKDRESFYNFQMAHDYFRHYDALYSRVIPIYSKPEAAGDFTGKRMYLRPKQRIIKPAQDNLTVNFYPEGGHLNKGTTTNMAFEVTDQDGKGLNMTGTLTGSGDAKIADITSTYMGRGAFTVKADGQKMKVNFTYNGKNYAFDLPKAEDNGVAIRLTDDGKLTIDGRGLPASEEIGVSVLCRGALKFYNKVKINGNGTTYTSIPINGLPTGVNDLTLFDSHGQVLADRLFFVNHHDYDHNTVTVSGLKQSYKPYEKVELNLTCSNATAPVNLSVSVRDDATDELSYDNGNIMTDLLLSSELKGFIAYPAYYFESDDATHQQALNLLMMVQGWRKYNWTQLADTLYQHPRYTPERTMTFEGGVYKMISIDELWNGKEGEMKNWLIGKAGTSGYSDDDFPDASNTLLSDNTSSDTSSSSSSSSTTLDTSASSSSSSSSSSSTSNTIDITSADQYGINFKGLKKDVMVKAELVIDTLSAASEAKTSKGHFIFQIPPYYGDATFFVSAYDPESSEAKIKKMENKGRMDEDAYADFYVKRDLFFPVYAKKYSYYENHLPEWKMPTNYNDSIVLNDGSYLIKNITIKANRRGKRSIDYSKPAWVGDAYEVYNDVTDRGLSFGKLNFRQFPYQICSWLYGNMGRYRRFNVEAKIDGYTFYRSFMPDTENVSLIQQRRSDFAILKDLKLKRIQNVRIYTDYEPRNEDAPLEMHKMEPDFIVNFEMIPNDGERYTYRDRRYILHGFTEPDDFYQPNYAVQTPQQPKDYRRTLYWNPNAVTDATGHLTATLYNNSKETEMKVSAKGLTHDGKIITGK